LSIPRHSDATARAALIAIASARRQEAQAPATERATRPRAMRDRAAILATIPIAPGSWALCFL
jgi:hypothetical protein